MMKNRLPKPAGDFCCRDDNGDIITEQGGGMGYTAVKIKPRKGAGDMAALEIKKELFEQLINGETPVLVDFWAPWCGYCRRIGAAYEKVAEEYKDTLIVGKVNVDEEPELEGSQQIELIPTLVLYRKGEVLGSIVAPGSKAAIDAFIRETLEQ